MTGGVVEKQNIGERARKVGKGGRMDRAHHDDGDHAKVAGKQCEEENIVQQHQESMPPEEKCTRESTHYIVGRMRLIISAQVQTLLGQ